MWNCAVIVEWRLLHWHKRVNKYKQERSKEQKKCAIFLAIGLDFIIGASFANIKTQIRILLWFTWNILIYLLIATDSKAENEFDTADTFSKNFYRYCFLVGAKQNMSNSRIIVIFKIPTNPAFHMIHSSTRVFTSMIQSFAKWLIFLDYLKIVSVTVSWRSLLLGDNPDGEMDGFNDASFNNSGCHVIKVVLWKLTNCEVHFHWNRVCKHQQVSDHLPTHTCFESFIQVKFIWLSL